MAVSDEWRAALVYSATTSGNANGAPGLRELKQQNIGLAESRYLAYSQRLRSVDGRRAKAPDNLSADVTALHRLIVQDDSPIVPGGFCFGTVPTSLSSAHAITIDWGKKVNLCRFTYDESQNAYQRWNGREPAFTWLSAAGLEEVPLMFTNVIVQQVTYQPINGGLPTLFDPVGAGRALVFTGGFVAEGRWQKQSQTDQTVFVDNAGNPIPLQSGTTFIVQMPNDACTWK